VFVNVNGLGIYWKHYDKPGGQGATDPKMPALPGQAEERPGSSVSVFADFAGVADGRADPPLDHAEVLELLLALYKDELGKEFSAEMYEGKDIPDLFRMRDNAIEVGL